MNIKNDKRYVILSVLFSILINLAHGYETKYIVGNYNFYGMSDDVPDSTVVINYIELSDRYLSKSLDSALIYIDSALIASKIIKNDKLTVESMISKAEILSEQGHFEKAIILADQMEVHYGSINSRFLGESYFLKGRIYAQTAKYVLALSYFQKSNSIFYKNNDIQGQAGCSQNLGNIYTEMSEYSKAIDAYLTALALNEQVGNEFNLAASYNNIAILYTYLYKNEEALIYFQKSAEIHRKNNNKRFYATALVNISEMYLLMNNSKKSFEYNRKADSVVQFNNIDPIPITISGVKGMLHFLQGEYDQALINFKKSLDLSISQHRPYHEGDNLVSIGRVYYEQKKYEIAIQYFKKALTISSENGMSDIQVQCHNYLDLSYFALGQYENAHEQLKQLSTLNDTLLTQEKVREIQKVESRYQLDSIERKNEALITQNNSINQDLQLQNKQLMWVIIALVLIIILALLMLKTATKLKKSNLLLAKQKAQIEEQNKLFIIKNEEIHSQRTELETTNEELEASLIINKASIDAKDMMLQLLEHYVAKPYMKIKTLLHSTNTQGGRISKDILKRIENEIDISENLIKDLYYTNSNSLSALNINQTSVEISVLLKKLEEEVILTENEDFKLESKLSISCIKTDEKLLEKLFKCFLDYLNINSKRQTLVTSELEIECFKISFHSKGEQLEPYIIRQNSLDILSESKNRKIKDNIWVTFNLTLAAAICKTLDYSIKLENFEGGLSIHLYIPQKIEFEIIDYEAKTAPIKDDEAEKLFKKIEKEFKENMIYQDTNLSIIKLAEILKVSPRTVSYVINKLYQGNFQKVVNNFRIEKAKELLLDTNYDYLSPMAIGFEAGFNSKSTFYSVFKNGVGISPKEFKAQSVSIKHN